MLAKPSARESAPAAIAAAVICVVIEAAYFARAATAAAIASGVVALALFSEVDAPPIKLVKAEPVVVASLASVSAKSSCANDEPSGITGSLTVIAVPAPTLNPAKRVVSASIASLHDMNALYIPRGRLSVT